VDESTLPNKSGHLNLAAYKSSNNIITLYFKTKKKVQNHMKLNVIIKNFLLFSVVFFFFIGERGRTLRAEIAVSPHVSQRTPSKSNA